MRAVLRGELSARSSHASQGTALCVSPRDHSWSRGEYEGGGGLMTRLLAPGVGLMNRLRYPQKFVLISCLFAVPLVLLFYLWLGEIADRLAFARRERAGLEYIVALRQLLEPLQRIQVLSALAAADRRPATGPSRSSTAGSQRRPEAVDRVDGRLGSACSAPRDLWRVPALAGGRCQRAAGAARRRDVAAHRARRGQLQPHPRPRARQLLRDGRGGDPTAGPVGSAPRDRRRD